MGQWQSPLEPRNPDSSIRDHKDWRRYRSKHGRATQKKFRRPLGRVVVDDDHLVRAGRVSTDVLKEEPAMPELIMAGDDDTEHKKR